MTPTPRKIGDARLTRRVPARPESRVLDFATALHQNDTTLEPERRNAMPNLTVKKIPQDLYERLKRSAEENRRSLNSEILVCMERALGTRTGDPEELLARVRAVRRTAGALPLTDAEVNAAKREGRP